MAKKDELVVDEPVVDEPVAVEEAPEAEAPEVVVSEPERYEAVVDAAVRVESFAVDGDAGSVVLFVNDASFVFDAEQAGALKSALAAASVNIVR